MRVVSYEQGCVMRPRAISGAITEAVRPVRNVRLKTATRQHLRANLLMLVAAMIWGSAFVAQRLSLDSIGPFLFTGLRFLLGACVVLILLACLRPRVAARPPAERADARSPNLTALLRDGTWLGLLLAAAISLQQIGLQY